LINTLKAAYTLGYSHLWAPYPQAFPRQLGATAAPGGTLSALHGRACLFQPRQFLYPMPHPDVCPTLFHNLIHRRTGLWHHPRKVL